MFPAYLKPVSQFFRARRNRALVALIYEIACARGGAIDILDIGGSIVFWTSIPEAARSQCRVTLINLPSAYDNLPPNENALRNSFVLLTGDARDLSRFADNSFDLVVCNSVIEHVGSWDDMTAAAKEARRVGRRGWIQVPAFEFPVEQHFLLPFVHWLADPLQVKLLHTFHAGFRRRNFRDQQMSVHHVRPLARGELKHLFPDASVHSEWVLFPKSHIAVW